MFLIDTSVWIEAFKKGSNFRLENYFNPIDISICLPIYQEILQGIKEDKAYFAMKHALDNFVILEPEIKKPQFEEAVTIYRQGRLKGITIRSSIDCLIAAIAIKNEVILIHKDRDFGKISSFTYLKEKDLSQIL